MPRKNKTICGRTRRETGALSRFTGGNRPCIMDGTDGWRGDGMKFKDAEGGVMIPDKELGGKEDAEGHSL